MQVKRRMAAQRERELRNYHQEQQYNRSEYLIEHARAVRLTLGNLVDINTQNKSDRANSPNAMNEDDRRELIARQHRALYGNDGGSFYEGGHFGQESHTPRPATQPPAAPPRPAKSATKSATLPMSAGVAPIGTRPAQNQGGNPILNKRATTPLLSPLSYGFAPNESLTTSSAGNERSTSAASNPSAGAKDSNMGGTAWGTGSAVWGKNSLGVQASVWG